MIQNKLFRDCLAAIPAEQKAEFDLSFGIAGECKLNCVKLQ